jgi:hypothetical protein
MFRGFTADQEDIGGASDAAGAFLKSGALSHARGRLKPVDFSMSVTTLTTPLHTGTMPARRKFTIIPRLDENPKIVAQAQTTAGKITVIAMAVCLLGWRKPTPIVFLVAVALVAFLPAYRRMVLAAASLYWILTSGLLNQGITGQVATEAGIHVFHPAVWILSGLACVSLVFGFVGLLIRRQRDSIIGRRPVLCLGIFFCLALAIAGTSTIPAGVRAGSWILVAPLSGFFWMLAYALRDWQRKSVSAHGIGSMLATLWSGTSSPTPMLKGPSHALKVEAVDAREFAVAQLKGIKLLTWIIVLAVISIAIRSVLVKGDIPTLEDAIDRNLTGSIPVWLCWESLTGSFILLVLQITMYGHTIVGGLRLLGFKVLRNTYAPFRARTIAEFWNRFYFYFKELLVDHFYYPVYLRYFKRSPRLRIVFATFAAAFFGNAFYHFGRDVNYIAQLGIWRALTGFQVYLFYAFLLATGISISQLRGKRRPASWFRTEVLSRVTVVLFFCLVHIFDDGRRTISLGAHFAFLFRLFGL